MEGTDGSSPATTESGLRGPSRLLGVLDRRSEWVEALIVLATTAAAFVVLGFLAQYFQDYFRIILIFFFAWLLAFLISPVADWLQRRVSRLPRGLAVVAVIVPLIVIVALVLVRVAASVADSLVQLAAALPGLAANPPPILHDLRRGSMPGDQRRRDRLIRVGRAGPRRDGARFGGRRVRRRAVGRRDAGRHDHRGQPGRVRGDRPRQSHADGSRYTPPEKGEDALLFRRSVGTVFAGFMRSQLVLGALYGVWAFFVSVVLGLPFAPATAFLAGLIMAIPIYGPYVSWLPPVIVALLVSPDLAFITAVLMLVGWFIDENILAPVVRAGALELHPIVVTFAFLLGAQLAGGIGAIVAIPLAAVIQAFVVKYGEQYRKERGWPPPDAPASEQPAIAPTADGDAVPDAAGS
jgi:predicted PurR-regulated permease PerM